MNKRFISCLLTVCMLLCTITSAMALSNEKVFQEISEKDLERTIEVTNQMIEANAYDITAENVKLLHDFNGNVYTLIECVPSGYYILNNDTGVYVEYSESAPSPYWEYENGENLYYGGPTYYYIERNGVFNHTVLVSETLSSDELSQMIVQSEELNRTLAENSNPAVLARLNSDVVPTLAEASEPLYRWVNNPDFFRNSKTGFGYASPDGTGGICGYIGANLLLQYWQNQGKFTLPYDQSQISDAELTLELYRIGIEELNLSAGTTGWQIADVINTFCRKNGLPSVAAWGLGQYNVTGEIDIKRPSILFGAFENAKKHAVVVYGYQYGTSEGAIYVAHYGWDNYSEVLVPAIIYGSNTCYRIDV